VLIGDMDTIALSAEIKYAALESLSPGITGTPGPGGAPGITGRRSVGTYGRAYLEKLIQIQLRLPPPLSSNLRRMLVPVASEQAAFPPTADELKAQAFQVATTAGSRKKRWPWLVGAVAALWIPPALLYHGPWWVLVIGVLVFLGAQVGDVILGERGAERRRRRTRMKLDREVYDVVKATETALTPDAEQELKQRLDKLLQDEGARWVPTPSITGSATIRRRIRQRIISGNELRAELDRAVLEVLPLSPRAAKRMFNHAHLLLDIGVERGIFATQPGLKASQLAAWVALTERWPSVATAITNDPTLLGKLEKMAHEKPQGAFRLEELTAMENDMGMTGLDSSLLDYLRRSDSLVSCVRLLVNFSPEADEGSAPGVAASLTSTGNTAGP
jgi:hypothetical protein